MTFQSALNKTGNSLDQVDTRNSVDSSRRRFCSTLAGTALASSAIGAIGIGTLGLESVAAGESPATSSASDSKKLYKAVKWWMIDLEGTPTDKFQLCQDLGFDGMELESPVAATTAELMAAKQATTMPIHGVVNTKHWEIRLSSPDADTRRQGREILLQAIRDANTWGGDTVLLVPGKVDGKNETHDHIWERSIVEIRKVLPVASQLGVRVLIENVWNGFCETPELFRDYIDEIGSPWVGVYFDIGNALKFAPSERWIRVLGSRIVKLDVKDWGKTNGFCKIGDGEVNWPAVREALEEINFSGWCTAEVAGGDRDRLADIARRMDSVLGI